MNVELALITLLLIVPLLTGLSLWFRSASDKGYLRVRDGIAGVLSDVSESLSGVRVVAGVQPPAPQRAAPPQRRRRVPRRQRPHRAGRRDRTARRTEFVGIMGQAMLLLIGGKMVQSGQLTVGQLTAFILYLNSFFQPIQQLVQQYNLYQQGQAAIVKLDELLATHPSVEEAPGARPLPPIEGDDRPRRRVVRVRPGDAGAASTSTSTSRPARRCRSSGRPAPASRPSPSSSRASTTRPRDESSSTATTCATSPSSRSGASSASCRRSRSSSRARCATTSRSHGPTPPTTR